MREAHALAVELTNCDREPIHIPGSVQPHGALLAVDPKTLRVVQAGGDTSRIFGAEPFELLGESIMSLFPPDRVARLQTMLNTEGPMIRPMHTFSIVSKKDATTVDTFIYRSGEALVFELEPTGENQPEDALALVQSMLARVQQAETTQSFCQGLAEEVRRVSGFDRVMVYRFLQDGSGVVDAEARGEDVESFLGLHYPASDIPRQARELYLNNWIRLIPNARYTPVPILPADDPRTGTPLDLSHSLIRSVSPIHLEYLANMGVVASMSLSIIMDGKLWGLIACHHRTPRFLSYRLRVACELFAQMASAKLETRVGSDEFGAQLRSKRIHEDLVTRMSGEADLAEGLTHYKPNLLDYIPAEGVGLWLDSKYTGLGQTPRPEQVANLVAWLNETAAEGIFHTDRLPQLYPPAAEFAEVASGLIALSVSKTPRDYVLWFRPEVIRTVTWAGNPSKPVETVDGGQRLSPRKSFSAWQESVRLHSRPWRNVEVEAAKTLRLSLMEVILRRIDQIAREREEAQVKQTALTAELDRRLAQWQAVAAELKEEAQRRAVVERELSQVLRSTVEDQEAERKRIARELHDSLGQTLTLLKFGLDEFGHALPDNDTTRNGLAALKGLANDVGSQVNRLAWEIRPTALDDLGLETSIRQLVETWSERLNMRFILRLAIKEQRLSPTVETTLYRVLQEAITNIARHADATRVAVLLEAREKEMSMIVEDNGRGFSPNEPVASDTPSKHLGLLGIRERLSLVSGTLEVESTPGKGCTLYIRVPL
jgi:light-regulated signal transduction histidine kinase (bacteriophytochrome)